MGKARTMSMAQGAVGGQTLGLGQTGRGSTGHGRTGGRGGLKCSARPDGAVGIRTTRVAFGTTIKGNW